MRRAATAWLFITLLLAASGSIAYFSHDPQNAWLTELRSWPVIGRLAADFQDAYRAPRQTVSPADGGVTVEVVPPPAEAVDAHPYAHLRPGAVLRRRPARNGAVLARLDRYYVIPYLNRSGAWVEVRLGRRRGWVEVGPPESGESPPLGEQASLALPLPGTPAPPAQLAVAESCMSAVYHESRLGPYALLTDDRQPGLIPVLDRLAAQVEPLYRERYGLSPRGAPRATIVLFARKSEFERFIRPFPRLHDIDPRGTTMPGIIAVYSEGLNRKQLEATLVHEITHLLNRRALGPALPSWIDEGMAEDLASSRISPLGSIDGARLAGMLIVDGSRRTLMGPKAGVVDLVREMSSRTAPGLERLTTLDWRQFVAVPEAAQHYREAGLFFRYLATGPALSQGPGPPRAGMVEFLRAVARGGPATGGALVQALGTSWGELDASFLAWLRSEIPPPFTLEDEVSRAVPGTASVGE